jgi:segregation and condensation protein B
MSSQAQPSQEARRAIEAVVMASPDPVAPDLLAQLVEISTTAVEAICEQLAAEYERDARGFVFVRVAGGYRFQTHPDLAPYVERFVLEGQHARLSPAALETLAIVAYKQPIGRAQLSAIRGVNVDATLRTLTQRGYVEEIDHEQTPGNPARFGTTSRFLERLGIDGLSDLPALGDFVPEANIVEALERGLRVPNDVGPDATVVFDDDEGGGSAAGGLAEGVSSGLAEGMSPEG